MEPNYEKVLQTVAATLIDARCILEEIETPSQDVNELHGEITRAHALCSQLISDIRKSTSTDEAASKASA
jgi:hypothetical protein